MIKYPFLDLATVNAPYILQLQGAAARVISSGRYIGGDEVEALETRMAQICGTEHAVGVSNGLDALTLVLKAYIRLGKLRPGDGVIVPANTYIASMLAITDAGMTLIPADADPATMNIDVTSISSEDASRAKAMVPVHLYGRNAWTQEVKEFVQTHNLLAIEDCAQAIGAQSSTKGISGGTKTGALGHAAGFSFYPTKNVGALGDAGIVTTDDYELAATVRALANYGADRRYHNIYCGRNCRLDAIQAAMISVKLEHMEEINARRRQNADTYDRCLNHPLITKPSIPSNPAEHVWHQYVIYVGGHREELQRYLDSEGVGWDIHYAIPPLHQPCYETITYCPHDYRVTDRLAKGILSLPISEMTSTEDVEEICSIVNRFHPDDKGVLK